MNTKNLYEKEDYDIYSIYYTDEECTKPYTGHVEEYWRGKLSWEADIVNGFMQGVTKEYNDRSGILETAMEMKQNKVNGLEFGYYENGKIASISIWVENVEIDYCHYDEAGRLTEQFILPEPYDILGINMLGIRDKILEVRKKYNLEKLNEEILKYGRPMKYGMPIYPVQLLDDKKGV